MNFKQWLLTETGHIILPKPYNITVLYGGQPLYLANVAMIDPRFEFMNIPPVSGSKSKKFLGDSDFSLPLVAPNKAISGWLVSKNRMAIFSGSGHWAPRPKGVRAPISWADHASFINPEGFDLMDKYKKDQAM